MKKIAKILEITGAGLVAIGCLSMKTAMIPAFICGFSGLLTILMGCLIEDAYHEEF
jgi:hypothetical protein